MRRRPAALRPLWLAAVLVLCGCERTVFQSPPSASARCDKALVGHWVSEGDEGGHDGELIAHVDASCTLRVEQPSDGGVKRSASTTLRSDRLAGGHYLWIDAAWAHAAFDVQASPLDRPGDIYLLSYTSTGRDRLTLYAVRHRALAHRVLDKDIAGELLARENALAVRIPGDSAATAALLRKYRLFDTSNGIGFRRAGDGAATR
ncbi:hypothetical protein [Chiayiivirga flava]|uniref:Lipoprotein n=1 Tax=Chiayiivirga flava TaxID=659595 RepID=A0A7W8D252_9GAMM|nr:hypothetical protein [Chiayiivirga flava]MBB5206593.1 hypothetical protein [Chiayiivirga flava]